MCFQNIITFNKSKAMIEKSKFVEELQRVSSWWDANILKQIEWAHEWELKF